MVAILLAVACIGCDISQKATFELQAQLQALYEQAAETISHVEAGTVSALATTVLYTPDCVFIDPSGQRESMAQAQFASNGALQTPPFATITSAIQKVVPSGDEVTVTVKVAVTADTPDVDRQAAMMGHERGWKRLPAVPLPTVETTTFRDTWVKAGDSWKMKSRQQLGKPATEPASGNLY